MRIWYRSTCEVDVRIVRCCCICCCACCSACCCACCCISRSVRSELLRISATEVERSSGFVSRISGSDVVMSSAGAGGGAGARRPGALTGRNCFCAPRPGLPVTRRPGLTRLALTSFLPPWTMLGADGEGCSVEAEPWKRWSVCRASSVSPLGPAAETTLSSAAAASAAEGCPALGSPHARPAGAAPRRAAVPPPARGSAAAARTCCWRLFARRLASRAPPPAPGLGSTV